MKKIPLSRYERHIDIPEVGVGGQQKICEASALIVGLGGLGCPAALYLAAAGIGRLGLADQDTVSLSNLQRQVLYGESDVGQPKTDCAERVIKKINAACDIEKYPFFLTAENARDIVKKYDIILDCTDNFDSRYLMNAACYAEGKPLVSASIYHHDGQIAVFKGHAGENFPCYQCLYPKTDSLHLAPSCKDAGILGPVAGVFGTLMATLTLKELLGIGEEMSGSMLMFNALGFETQKIRISKNKDCTVCGAEPARQNLAACQR